MLLVARTASGKKVNSRAWWFFEGVIKKTIIPRNTPKIIFL
jgi:hypothetical protein